MNTRMVETLKYQQGLSGLGWLGVIALFGFGILCSAKIFPAYYDNWEIQNSLKTLGELRLTDNEFEGVSDSAVKSHLSKYFQVNGISHEMLDELKITRKKGRAYVDLNWEHHVNFISNIDVIVKFENQYDSLNPTDCCRVREDNTNKSE